MGAFIKWKGLVLDVVGGCWIKRGAALNGLNISLKGFPEKRPYLQ